MGKIDIQLLTTHNSVATMNDVALSMNENEYYIVAGEENATEFEIHYNSTAFNGYTFYVSMVNAKGFAIDEAAIVNNKFTLPNGMAVAGYGYVLINARKNDIKVVFMPIKVKVHNTVSAWRSGVSAGTSLYISNGDLYYVDDDGVVTDLGTVVGDDGVGISTVTLGQDDISLDFNKTDGTKSNVVLPTVPADAVVDTEVATLVASSIEIGTVTSGVTPSVSVAVVGNKAQMSFVLPRGDTGSAGADGVGVSTITVSNGYLVFGMTDGTSISVALPVYDGTGD